MESVAAMEDSIDEMGGLFTRCAKCAVMGADVTVTLQPGSPTIYACNEVCAKALKDNGVPTNAVPSTAPVQCSMFSIIYKCGMLEPSHIVDAAQWLLAAGADQVATRVTGLHAGMVAFNKTRGGPYSHMPLPLDPTLYNLAMAYARRYAQIALGAISDYSPAPTNQNEVAVQRIVEQRAVNGESEASAHSVTLWKINALFWRHYFFEHDWQSWCALGKADLANISHLRPHDYPAPDPATQSLVSADTRASMRRTEVAVAAAVQLLFNSGMTKDLINSTLINGLFAPVADGEFDIRPEASKPNTGTPDQVISIEEVDKMMAHAMARRDEEFIQQVTESHASITRWVKARFDRAVGRARGFTSRSGYSWPALADRLYQLALANKCSKGMIADAAGLAIANLYTGPARMTFANSFVSRYLSELQKASDGKMSNNWRRDFDQFVAASRTFVKSAANRDDRIGDYTCKLSNSSKLSIDVWRTLPADIARQVLAMGKYLYMGDMASGVSEEKRRLRVANDIKSLVKEVTRKVGTDDMTIIFQAISPDTTYVPPPPVYQDTPVAK